MNANNDPMTKRKKLAFVRSRKTRKSRQNGHRIGQKHVGINRIERLSSPILKYVKTHLKQKVDKVPTDKKTYAYETVAEKLSVLAGLKNGHSWGWRYIASVCSGSTLPSRKFVRVFFLYDQNFKPRQKQWFYFVRRGSVASFYDRSIFSEMIRSRMKELGYRPTTYTRYIHARKAA